MRRGWLKNPKRRARRDKPLGFTDNDVKQLIKDIEDISDYISQTLTRHKPELNELMRTRDKAMIAITWIWFKRGGEVLKLKRKDIALSEKEVLVTFSISKKKRRSKICIRCDEKNGFKSKFCKKCGENLENTEVFEEGGEKFVTKRKTLKNSFVKYVIQWLKRFDELIKDDEAWLFPPLRVVFSHAYFDFLAKKPMTIENFDRILKRLDVTITSCLFRYGGAEKYLMLGYLPHQLKEIGDWSSSRMPEIYAERRGITPI